MKTTAKKRPAAAKRSKLPLRRVTAKQLTAPPLDVKPTCEMHVHPSHVDLYFAEDRVPSSRVANGAPGSDAAQKVVDLACTLNRAFNVIVRRFDAQGIEVTE